MIVQAGPVEAQRLIFGGKILEDAKTVKEYDLTKGENPAPLFLVINPETAKRIEEQKKKAAEEAKKKAEVEAKAKAEAEAKAKAEDPAVIAKNIADVAKRLGSAKTIAELISGLEKELNTLKPKKPEPAAAKAGGGAPAGGGAGGAAAEWDCPACTAHVCPLSLPSPPSSWPLALTTFHADVWCRAE
jgi:hypothetical protein